MDRILDRYQARKKLIKEKTTLEIEFLFKSCPARYNIDELREIHRTINGGIFQSAGKFSFEHHEFKFFKSEKLNAKENNDAKIDDINQLMAEICNLKDKIDELDEKEFIKTLVVKLVDIWKIKIFYDCNLRTVLVYAVMFGKECGFDVDEKILMNNLGFIKTEFEKASDIKYLFGKYDNYDELYRIFIHAFTGLKCYGME